jgi:hypothetical protein
MGRVRRVRELFATPEAVYGTVVFAAIVAAVSDEDEAELDILQVLIFSVVSIVVFWGAHVYATTIARHGKDGLGTTIAAAVKDSWPMLTAVILPSVPLILGVAGVVPPADAVEESLSVAMGVLGVLGFLSFWERGRPLILCFLGGLGAAFFGLLVIGINAAVH